MQEPDFSSILNAFVSPILVARPVREGSAVRDFQRIYINEAFVRQVDDKFNKYEYFSEFKNFLNPTVPWLDMADKAMNKVPQEPVTFFSEFSNKWFKVQMQATDEGLVVVNLEDETESVNQNKKLNEIAYTDLLTNLPNRNKFTIEFNEIIEKAAFCGNKLAVLLIDIDNMKNINDSKGHQAGDQILKTSAKLLNMFSKNHISSYRYGDDEFVVLIDNYNSMDSLANATDAIFEAFALQDVSLSGGISLFPEHSTEPDDLIRFADIAMHAAKKNGKNNFKHFEPDMQRVFIQKLNILDKMNSALLEGKFRQVYQPQFDVQSGELRGFEALIRWKDDDLGNIPPSFFIPLAEECGIIVQIGEWVLETSFATLKHWQNSYNFKGVVSVNISPIQLKQTAFIDKVTNMLDKYQIDPNYIEIEITEGIMIDNMDDAINKMKALKNMGFKISLDDFGTGYSSLSYLQMLPLDTLKIDKSFINDITGKDGVQANITNSIITMVSKMGLSTIAEGVEKVDQYDLLKQFNCHIIQGFLKGKPMEKEVCDEYLSGNAKALLSLENDASK